MKKILVLLCLVFASVLLLGSCGQKYEPVESTEEESRVVYTMTLDGVTYEVKYELYRMLFLNNKSLVDGGDDSVWSSDKRDEYVAEIDKIIYDRAAEIFSVFALARKLDISPYSVAVEDKIYEYIVLSVEGNQADVQGHGTYEKFLASLKERNMNYSVMELLLRYSILSSLVYEKYRGVSDKVLGELPGDIILSEEDILAYYMGDECVRVLQIVADERDRIVTHRERMSKKASDLDIALYVVQSSTALASDCIVDKEVSGLVIGKYSLDTYTYGGYADAVFALSAGELSEIIEVDGKYYVVYKLQKDEEHFERCYDTVKQSYIDNTVGKQFGIAKQSLLDSLESGKDYIKVDHANISMN